MRNDFIKLLIKEAKKNKNIYLVNGDLGYSVLEPFKKKFPDRYINVGISEQNMMGMAAGLAMEGKKVFVYSIVNFLTFRCLEQIRNDVCYHNLDVNLISIGSGFSYGSQGYTHHGIEDVSLINSLPNIKIYSPSNISELKYTSKIIFKKKKPKYIRLPRKGTDFKSGKVSGFYCINNKSNLNIISYGEIISECIKATQKINKKVGIYSWPLLFDEVYIKYIESLFRKSKTIIIVEEHIENGGLGSFITSLKSKKNYKTKIILVNVNKKNYSHVGSRDFLLKKNGLNFENLKSIIMKE